MSNDSLKFGQKGWLKQEMTDQEGLFQGGKDGRAFGRARDLADEGNLNLVSLGGLIPRDNTGFADYGDNPELYDRLGQEGIKFREAKGPVGWFMVKIGYGGATIGNQVIIPSS